jgi:MFS family permease
MRGGLWRVSGFRNLWLAQTTSLLGSQVTLLAFPLLALLTLHASALQVSVLWAMEFLPVVLLGLPAGAWVERLRHRPVLIVADIVRGLATASIPIAYALGGLSMVHLYAVAFVVGLGTLFFDVAHLSYLPSLIREDQLADGNAKLEGSRSFAQLAGPSLGGILVQALTAPAAVVADAVSYGFSAMFLLFIRDHRKAPAPTERRLRGEIGEGIRFVASHPLLRPLALCTAIANLAFAAVLALQVIYAQRTLHLSPTAIGIVLAVGNAGGLVGAFLSGPLSRRFASGVVIIGSVAVFSVGAVLLPLSTGAVGLGLGLFTVYVGVVIYNVAQVTLRQTITPEGLLSRTNATLRFVEWGTLPIGAAVGGILVGPAGLRGALWIAAIVNAVSIIPPLLSPVRRLTAAGDGDGDQEIPQNVEMETT